MRPINTSTLQSLPHLHDNYNSLQLILELTETLYVSKYGKVASSPVLVKEITKTRAING